MTKEVIVILSSLPWDYPTDYVKQTARELAKKGEVAVFWPSEMPTYRTQNLTLKTYDKKEKKITFFPSVGPIPFQRFKFIWQIDLWLNLLVFKTLYFLKFGRRKPVFWLFSPFVNEAIRFLPKNRTLVYDRVDHFGSLDRSEDQKRKIEDKKLIEIADFCFTNSPYALKYIKKYNKKSFLVPCGCDTELFNNSSVILSETKNLKIKKLRKEILHFVQDDTRPIIGLVGSLDHRLDFKLLQALIKRRPDWSFVFVGSPFSEELAQFEIAGLSGELSELKKLPNVTFLKHQPKEDLPAIIAGFDVCLIPHDVTQEAVKGCNPMKLYEYLGLGKPVVSTSIEAVKVYEPVVKIGKTAGEFEQAIEEFLKRGDNAKEILARRKIAKDNSWEEKVGEMWKKIKNSSCKSSNNRLKYDYRHV